MANDVQAEESARLLLASVRDYAIFTLDPSGRVATWNAGAERIKGYTADEIVGEHFSCFYTREEVERAEPDRELEVAADRGACEIEGWRVRRDGSWFWASVLITALRDDSGSLRGYAKVTRDVTERRRLQLLGDASVVLGGPLDHEAALQRVAELTIPFLADWCAVHIVENDRLRMLAIAHRDPRKVEFAKELDQRYPADPAAPHGVWQAIRTRKPTLCGEVADEELERASRDGEHLSRLRALALTSALLVPLESRGRALGTIAFAHAESGRHYSESDLGLAQELATRCALAIDNARVHQEAELYRHWLAAVVHKIPAGIICAEAPSGRIVLANEEAERIFGQPVVAESFLEYSKFKRFYPDGRPYEIDDWPLMRSMKHGEIVDGEEVHLQVHGGRTVIALSSAPVRDRAGHIIAGVVTFQDVTEHKLAQEEAERQVAFKERFIGILGHDLRSPLSAISLASHILRRQGLPEPQAAAIARIAGSAERMSRMIDEVLDLTRSRLGGGIPVVPRRTDIVAVSRAIIDELRVAHPECELRWDAEQVADPWGIWDPDRLAQVVSNLVGNAITYGCVEGRVAVKLVGEDRAVTLEVHNAGRPIPSELMPVLFDPFRRCAPTDGPGREGLGLGLFIANQIVVAHGGSIDVRSSVQEGTCFTVRLPRTPQDVAGKAE
jgi:PAS domain S-box-containing protein